MDWQKINFTTHQIALGALDKILKEFMKATLKPNTSMNKVGVFASKTYDKKISLFFTPNATIVLSPVIAFYESSPCNKPDAEEIESFIFGAKSCWELLN